MWLIVVHEIPASDTIVEVDGTRRRGYMRKAWWENMNSSDLSIKDAQIQKKLEEKSVEATG